eukprot:m51a1_g2532 hypothetical protein (295) ;mRNA; r:247095-248503
MISGNATAGTLRPGERWHDSADRELQALMRSAAGAMTSEEHAAVLAYVRAAEHSPRALGLAWSTRRVAIKRLVTTAANAWAAPIYQALERTRSLVDRAQEACAEVRRELGEQWASLECEAMEAESAVRSLPELPEDLPSPRAPSNGSSLTATRTAKKTRGVLRSTRTAEERSLDEFVALTGGITGGWGDEEHLRFLKARGGTRAEMARALPGRSAKDVSDHERWYSAYTKLVIAKRDAVQQLARTRGAQRAARDSASTQQAQGQTAVAPEMLATSPRLRQSTEQSTPAAAGDGA